MILSENLTHGQYRIEEYHQDALDGSNSPRTHSLNSLNLYGHIEAEGPLQYVQRKQDNLMTHLEREVLEEVSSASPLSVGSSVTLKFVMVSSSAAAPVLASEGGSHFSRRSSWMAP